MPHNSTIFDFIDKKGTFIVKNPGRFNLYFPLTDKNGSLLSCISPNLSGDIKSDNDHFLTVPASVLDLKYNLLCRREFYLKADNRYIRFSLSDKNDLLEAGLLYHKLTKRKYGLKIEITNFIPYDAGVEIMQVKVTNESKSPLDIIPTSFIPLYGRSEKNLRDHRHVSSLLNRVELLKYGIILKPTMVFDERKHLLNNTQYFSLGYENNGIAPIGQFPSIEYFCGESSLESPDAVYGNVKPVNKNSKIFDGKEAASAFRFRQRRLKPKEEVAYTLIMGISQDRAFIDKILKRFDTLNKVEVALDSTKEYWQGYLNQAGLGFKDCVFNNWLLWVKLQPQLRRLFGCSFLPHFDYGKGGRGWRDLWQDALSLLLFDPDKTKEMIKYNFRGVRLDGSNATIITKDGSFLADRNRINRVWMDHGVWPYLTLKAYLNKTEDLSMLLKDEVYFRDNQLKRSKEMDTNFCQRDYVLRDKTGRIYRGSILEHVLVENLVQFFNVGEHNVIRLEGADWNDGLDMAKDKGESVAFSFMYAHNLDDICIYLESLKRKTNKVKLLKEIKPLLDTLGEPVNYNDYCAKQKRLGFYFDKTKEISGKRLEIDIDCLIADLRKKSGHLAQWLRDREWLKDLGFFNGYYDNRGRKVEGLRNGRIRMMLASQVFAILSGVATDEQVRLIWKAANKYLRDKKHGGFRLNTDFGGVYMDLGRSFGFSYGDKENGAFFNHMNIMFAHALYKRGFTKEAQEVLNSIYKMCLAAEANIYPCLPEYFNAQGQGLYLYLTGSASWYIYTLASVF